MSNPEEILKKRDVEVLWIHDQSEAASAIAQCEEMQYADVMEDKFTKFDTVYFKAVLYSCQNYRSLAQHLTSENQNI